MPKQLDQLPSDPTSLAREIAALKREMRELRAARRMGEASVGRLRIYSDDGQTLLAELGPDGAGGAGLWTRGLQDPDQVPIRAYLTSGSLRFEPVDARITEVAASAEYTTLPDTGSDLVLVSGAVQASDWRAVMDLGSVKAGPAANVTISGFREVDGVGESGPCNMDLDGVFTSANVAYGAVTITPSAANTPTSANVTGLSLRGSSFFAQVTANTSAPGTAVTGVSFNNLTATGLTLWLTRTNTTATSVNWMVIGL